MSSHTCKLSCTHRIPRFKHPVCLFRVLFFSIDQDAEVFVRWQWSNSVYNATFKVHGVQSHQSSSIHYMDRVGWIAGILRIYVCI